ncbi:AAA domain-containing protein [Crocinitomix algicola]|uniref:AAA domain-containing protein n=1 Tax=Crocinitomix algicola TaxID=1740263 RepID=UPI00082FBEB9|nr:AAA domain-containing protein [Crocinitomix algicola]
MTSLLKQRLANLKEGLLLERDEELKHFESLIQQQSIQDQIVAQITLYPLAFIEESYNRFDNIELTFQFNENQEPQKFNTNGRVSLFSQHTEEKLEALIVHIKEDQITLELFSSDSPEWLNKGKIGIHLLPDTQTIDIQLKTIEKIEKEELIIPHQFYQHQQKNIVSAKHFSSEELNKSQNIAVGELLGEQPFHIVHGPPGTGKTKILTQSVIALVNQGKRVLVAAPSNAAVDHITSKIGELVPEVVRVGRSIKIAPVVTPFTLKEKINNDTLMNVVERLKRDAESIRKKAFKYKRNFDKTAFEERKRLKKELKEIRQDIRHIERDIRKQILTNAPVITGTFMGIYNEDLQSDEWDALIIDEAGQAIETLIWSISHLSNKLILAGDPLQLPPSVFSTKAIKFGLNISLLEMAKELDIPTHFLDVQYRMNNTIMGFSNGYFYDNKLASGDLNANQCIKNENFAPIEFIDTAGCSFDEELDESGGIYNQEEANLVKKRVEEFSHFKSIGIISPYRKQVQRLKHLLFDLAEDCQTIDSFQGQERDIIVISLVRSNENNNLGFLTDYRRLNVALTRARKKLVIIGDSATFGQDSFYQALLKYVEENGVYRTAWEYFES